MFYYKNIICLLFFSILALSAKPQGVEQRSLKEAEDSLTVLMQQVYSDKPFSLREVANNKFHSLLRGVLAKADAFDYPFDSLKHIGRIKSDDKKVRIFTWNLPLTGGYQKYYGLIVLRNGNTQVFELVDNRKSIVNPIKDILSSQNWMGALYYSIIDESYKGQTYYILLGLDFNNLFSSKKIIDVLSFGKDSEPVFGFGIFKVGDMVINRIVFEFSARASMSLRYIADSKTIVFDHLSPSRPDFSENYQFYGPDFTFDGFRFDDGYWIYVRNLDMKNPKRKPAKLPDSPDKISGPGFLYKSKSVLPKQILR